jgi:hypothetical protein
LKVPDGSFERGLPNGLDVYKYVLWSFKTGRWSIRNIKRGSMGSFKMVQWVVSSVKDIFEGGLVRSFEVDRWVIQKRPNGICVEVLKGPDGYGSPSGRFFQRGPMCISKKGQWPDGCTLFWAQ